MIRKLLPMLLLLLLILTACGATNTATTPQLATALLTNSVTTTPQLVNTPTISVTASIAVSVSVEHKAFTVNFEGFESQAELTYPAQGKAPFLTVVMFAGAGFWDLDTTFVSQVDGKRSTNFKQTAQMLAEKGFAVVRFNKRGVKGFNNYDQSLFSKNTIKSFVEDGGRVLDALKQFEQVDQKKIVLYGWSEGTIVASNLAVTRPDMIAGLVLQAGPAGGYKGAYTYQQLELGVPYVAKFDANQDDALSMAEILTAFTAGSGSGLSSLRSYFFDVTSSLAKPVLSKQTDQNGDGKLSIAKELKPAVEAWLSNFDKVAASSPGYLDFDKTLSTVPQAVAKLAKPILILQGENDGFVPARDANAIADAIKASGNKQLEVKIYPTLGHAFNKVDSPATDNFGQQENKPIEDLTIWLTTLSK